MVLLSTEVSKDPLSTIVGRLGLAIEECKVQGVGRSITDDLEEALKAAEDLSKLCREAEKRT